MREQESGYDRCEHSIYQVPESIQLDQIISTKTDYRGDIDNKGLLDLAPEARDVRGAAALFFV